MTSSDNETWEPQPPALLPPWHTPEREKLQEQARRFAMDEVLPVADELDPQKGEIPASLLARLAELGYFGITVPAEQGGLGLGVFEYCMVSEELARAWMSTASILARSQGLGTAVADADRRHELLARSARGDWIGAIALSEPDAGSDLAGVSTRAVLDGDEWVVTGHKRWCGNAKAADFIQVLVRERDPEEGESRSAGLVNLLLEKKRGEFPEGLSGYPIDKVGYHGFLTWDLRFDGVRIPKDNVIDQARAAQEDSAEEGEAAEQAGFAEAQKFLNTARVHTAARAVGLARAALEDSILYLQEREQFGHPIGDFQALRFNVAEMAAQIEQSRAFYRQVAHLLDLGAALRQGGLDGEARGHRDVGAGDQPGHAAARRQRLHDRAPGGAALARRPADHHLRGHQRDPEADHQRPPAAPEPADLAAPLPDPWWPTGTRRMLRRIAGSLRGRRP